MAPTISAQTMSAPKPPYDPVRTVDGTFNGSIKRIAYVFKDHVNYGAGTKVVLGATSKKFQDALDDCEIQILDAKWYLEHQLQSNKLRRDAEERALEEGVTAAKRKRDEMNGITKANGISEPEENPPKRLKGDNAVADKMDVEEPAKAKPSLTSPAPTKLSAPNSTPTQPESNKSESAKAALPIPKPTLPAPVRITNTDSNVKPVRSTPQDTPATATAEDFNFESMFVEPSAADGSDTNANDINFDDLGLGSNEFDNALNNLQDPGSLGTLLPGVESYANQEGDDSGFNFGSIDTNNLGDGMGGLGGDGTSGDMTDNFALPEIGNSFDAFLNDETMMDGVGGGGSLDGDDYLLNDNSMMGLGELDSFFK